MSATELIVRQSCDALLDELRRAGAQITDHKSFRCPFHDDRKPSAGIYEEEGVWRYKCHGCGVGGDVLDIRALNEKRDVADVVKDEAQKTNQHTGPVKVEKQSKPKRVYGTLAELQAAAVFISRDRLNVPHLAATFIYTNPTTQKPDLIVLRVEDATGGKTFWQARPEGEGFVFGQPDGLLPIYNRGRIALVDAVLVVEGEKAVHALHDCGLVATTSPMGALKGDHADWSPLAGKTCYLWPDNDTPDQKYPEGKGIKHMREVAAILERLDPAPRLFWIDPQYLDLPPKGDAVDFIEKHAKGDKEVASAFICEAMADAEPMGASREVQARIQAIKSGHWKAVPWSWGELSLKTQALLPGTITLLCGPPGASKSFFILDAMAYWREQGIKIALYALEEDRSYHLQRVLAQAEGISQLTNVEWVRDNIHIAEEAANNQSFTLDDMGRSIWDAPDTEITYEMLLKWTDDRAASGCRVIIIDPITMAATNDKPWVADARFMNGIKSIARRRNCSIVVVSHPKKGAQGAGIDELAGGAAFTRFAQTVLCLVFHPEPVKVMVETNLGNYQEEANREIFMAKTRNGTGQGRRIAFRFDSHTLRFVELGLVERTKK